MFVYRNSDHPTSFMRRRKEWFEKIEIFQADAGGCRSAIQARPSPKAWSEKIAVDCEP